MILKGIKGKVEKNYPLNRLNTWKIGGVAELVFWPEDVDELSQAFSLAKSEKMPIRLLGRGSNVLLPDEGLAGITVITTALNKIYWKEDLVRVESGYSLARLAQEAAKRGLTGLEFAGGIPGTVGGAIIMNAGAHGSDIQKVLLSVKVLTFEGEIKTLTKDEIEFGYRECSLRDQAWVLEGTFKLGKGNVETIKNVMVEYLKKRKNSQPLEFPNAGSVFRNPEGDSAGRLIEEAGWKGRNIGGAKVSDKHANFIINTGTATATDVLTLIQEIQRDVLEKYDVKLKTEVQCITPN